MKIGLSLLVALWLALSGAALLGNHVGHIGSFGVGPPGDGCVHVEHVLHRAGGAGVARRQIGR